MKYKIFFFWISFLFVTGFFLITVFMHLINPDIDPVKFPLSIYALTKYGQIQNIGFFMIAASEIILAINLFLQNKDQNKFISVFLLLAGLAVLFVGIFQMDMEGMRTVQGMIHIYAAAIHFALFIVTAILFGLKQMETNIRSYSLYTGYVTFLLSTAMLIILRNEETLIFNYYGLIQKLDILLIITWLGVISLFQLRSLT